MHILRQQLTTAFLESAEEEKKVSLVSNSGTLALESDALPTALRGPYSKCTVQESTSNYPTKLLDITTNSVDPDEVAQDEPPRMDLHCLLLKPLNC